MINNKNIFKNLIFWISKFIIAKGEIIQLKKIGIITIFLLKKNFNKNTKCELYIKMQLKLDIIRLITRY